MKKAIFRSLALGMVATFGLSQTKAQEKSSTYYSGFKTWSIGINAGLTTPSIIIGGQNDFSKRNAKIGFGLYLKKQFNPIFSIRLDGNIGEVGGNNDRPFESRYSATSSRSFRSFSTKFFSGAVSGQVNLLNLNLFKQQNTMQLYSTAGIGLINFEPTLTSNTGVVTAYNPKNVSELVVPVGVGAKFKLSDGVNLDLGYTMNFVDSDNLDGVWTGGKNDKYGYTYAGLEFMLGKKGKKQLAFQNPSAETYEQLADAKIAAENAQKQVNALKEENVAIKSELAKFKVDSDKDGVSDIFDKCPGTEIGVAVDGSGCPLPKAAAPIIQRIEKTVISQQDKLIVADAIKNLEFDSAKSTIRPTSYASLDKVAELLKSKGFSLNLAGHTDDSGSDVLNQQLSESRAAAVKAYLESKGVDAAKVTSEGFGESRPIASNKTAAGRQKNRRVEFTLSN